MASRPGLLEKQAAAFADNGEAHLGTPKKHRDMGCSVVAIAKRHAGDRLLEKTLKQIGEALDLSKERVRQIELIALQKLRHSLSAEEFDMLTG